MESPQRSNLSDFWWNLKRSGQIRMERIGGLGLSLVSHESGELLSHSLPLQGLVGKGLSRESLFGFGVLYFVFLISIETGDESCEFLVILVFHGLFCFMSSLSICYCFVLGFTQRLVSLLWFLRSYYKILKWNNTDFFGYWVCVESWSWLFGFLGSVFHYIRLCQCVEEVLGIQQGSCLVSLNHTLMHRGHIGYELMELRSHRSKRVSQWGALCFFLKNL